MQAAAATRDSHPTAQADVPLKDIQKRLALRVPSPDDWRHWTTKGFVIVRQAVPVENVERLVDVLWSFDEKDPADPSTWHAPQRRDHVMTELNGTGMIEASSEPRGACPSSPVAPGPTTGTFAVEPPAPPKVSVRGTLVPSSGGPRDGMPARLAWRGPGQSRPAFWEG